MSNIKQMYLEPSGSQIWKGTVLEIVFVSVLKDQKDFYKAKYEENAFQENIKVAVWRRENLSWALRPGWNVGSFADHRRWGEGKAMAPDA